MIRYVMRNKPNVDPEGILAQLGLLKPKRPTAYDKQFVADIEASSKKIETLTREISANLQKFRKRPPESDYP